VKYVLEGRLGAGGMAEVFRARQTGAAGFSRPVAVKRMNAALSGDETFARMFVAEAHTAALLQHPNIVAVIDFDRDESGALFLVMELIEGADLARLAALASAKGERISSGLAAHIAAEALNGLGHAHELVHEGMPLQIVHRDVSPQNILISRSGAVKVADFGIAKVTASAAGQHTGGIKGKLAYIALFKVLLFRRKARTCFVHRCKVDHCIYAVCAARLIKLSKVQFCISLFF